MSDNKPSNFQDSLPEDDDFGLPEGSMKPLADQDNSQVQEELADPHTVLAAANEGTETAIPPGESAEKREPSSTRSTWMVILVLLLITTMGSIAYLLGFLGGSGDKPPALTEETVEKVAEQPVVADTPSIAAEVPVDVERSGDEIKLIEITSKSSSPRYFVVVGSFIDDDLARDYAKKLNQSGHKTYLIHPYGDIDFFRLAVEENASVTEALTVIERVQADFEENLWVLKY